MNATKTVRAAIYVRKSNAQGLEIDYNSLDAQTDACRAYIIAQAPNGWVEYPKVFSDGGFSGGTLERPALKEMMAKIEQDEIDVVVIYKIDRLVRSIVGFVHLQEIFEKHSVSFVSITQQIDTSTAAGRAMLSLLVSFGQFEREMCSDRIKDKVRAAMARGIFCGGIPPFGYKSQDGKLVPDPETADVAKSVFETFIRLKSPLATAREMNERGLRLRGNRWQSHNVHRILLNPRYAGDVRIGDKVVRGQHEPLVTRETFESAKAILESLKKPRQQRTGEPTNALLEKLIFCGECNCAMSYRWTLRRHGDRRKEYGYYVCRHTFTYGTSSCQVKTVPAAVVETEVERAVERIFRSSLEFVAVAARKAEIPQTMILGGIRADGVLWGEIGGDGRRRLVRTVVERVTVRQNSLEIVFNTRDLGRRVSALADIGIVQADGTLLVRIPVVIKVISGNKRIMRTETNATLQTSATAALTVAQNPLLRTLARGYAWLQMIDRGEVKTVSELATKTGVDPHFVRHTLRLPLLSPKIQRAIINGTESEKLTLTALRTLETDVWEEQERLFGFADAQ